MTDTSATGGYLVPTSTPPIYDISLDHFLQAIVVGITGLDPTLVRRRWQQDAPKRPPLTTTWGAVGIQKIEAMNMVAQHYGADNSGQGDTITTMYETLFILCTFYGPAAWATATQFRDGLWIPQNREELMLIGAEVTTIGNIMQNAELINNEWLPRTDMVITICREINRTYSVLNLLSAKGTIITVDARNEPWDTLNVNAAY